MNSAFSLQPNGDAALDILFSDTPSEALSETLMALAHAIEEISLPEITELVPAYQCLTVCFDPLRLSPPATGEDATATLTAKLSALTREVLLHPTQVATERRLIRIPVCYDREFAPDLEALSAHTGLGKEEIIARHSAPYYLVHMLGFTPGFLYLGGLDPQLYCPRKPRPELAVPAGSVGIGGTQTGIYPQATPGGWQIIGRTPLALFRPGLEPSFIARPLDRVQFKPITAESFSQYDPFAPVESAYFDTASQQQVAG